MEEDTPLLLLELKQLLRIARKLVLRVVIVIVTGIRILKICPWIAQVDRAVVHVDVGEGVDEVRIVRGVYIGDEKVDVVVDCPAWLKS